MEEKISENIEPKNNRYFKTYKLLKILSIVIPIAILTVSLLYVLGFYLKVNGITYYNKDILFNTSSYFMPGHKLDAKFYIGDFLTSFASILEPVLIFVAIIVNILRLITASKLADRIDVVNDKEHRMISIAFLVFSIIMAFAIFKIYPSVDIYNAGSLKDKFDFLKLF